MYWTLCVEWAGDHFGLGLTQFDPLLMKIKICVINDFLHFPSLTLIFDFRLQICYQLVTVSTKLEVSAAFLFRKYGSLHGETDEVQHLKRPPT